MLLKTEIPGSASGNETKQQLGHGNFEEPSLHERIHESLPADAVEARAEHAPLEVPVEKKDKPKQGFLGDPPIIVANTNVPETHMVAAAEQTPLATDPARRIADFLNGDATIAEMSSMLPDPEKQL